MLKILLIDPPELGVMLKVLWLDFFVVEGREMTGKWYSVTQSLCNSSLGDVVLDSFNMVYGDEGSI